MMKRIAEETIVKEKHCHLNQHIAISELKIVTEGFITIVSWTAPFYLHLSGGGGTDVPRNNHCEPHHCRFHRHRHRRPHRPHGHRHYSISESLLK